jgi:secreted Zn-dependent insulinase-like peptidase
MTDKEKEIQALEEKLEQIANDLIDPMLDNQTTFLLHAMRKVREKINDLVAE